MVVAQKKKVIVCVLEEGKIWRGRERNRSMGKCPIELTLLFLSFSFFSFLFSFLSFFFSSCFVFSFSSENMLCFLSCFTGHGKSLFIVLAATMVLPFCPLTAFVWSRRTCRPPEVCATHPCQTEASFNSPPIVALLSCHGINAFSLYSQSMHQRFPLKLVSFGWSIIPAGRTS